MSQALPGATAFRRGVIGLSFWVSLPGLAIILAFFVSLLHLTHEQWVWFFGFTAIYAVGITPPMARMQSRILAPIGHYLDHRDDDALGDAERRAAFEAVLDLPRRLALVGGIGWLVPCALVSLLMSVRFPQFGLEESLVVVLAGVAAGFVAASFMIFLVKRRVEDVRYALASAIPDPAERAQLVRPIPVRAKVLACVAGVTTVPVIFAVALAFSEATDALDAFAIRWQGAVLDGVAARMEVGLDAAVEEVIGDRSMLPAPLELDVVDLSGPDAGTGLEPHVVAHLRASREAGATAGSSASLPASSVFAWRALPGDRILVAATPRSAIRLDGAGVWVAFAALLAIATGVGLALAWLLAGDISRATHALRAEAERLASGDLRRGRVYESEDELGELSRSFEDMSQALRSTVARVAEAADRVEATAGEITAVSETVASVTADQVRGIQQASTSMEAINEQVRGIANSSQALNGSVEESSSSILELGASGQDLNDTATTLSSRVEEVSSSIEQMVRSVRQVAENTEALAEASVETSASMEEMASSLREVDTSAEQAARLSSEVVETAETGQAKVRQTIEGMDAIRVATETAEQVIRNLGSRTTEIGAIVDVIDDVADETNLLALNAAIIAAQAGEHGRAFSVVADEIKDLADRVLASTKEIGGLIRAVQEESGNAIGAIERGTRSVASGVDLSAEAGVSLEEITRASRESGTRIQGIVNAVREQARAASHVVELMERVRTGVEEIRNAATEQEHGNSVVYRGAMTMREVAQQVRGTTEEQARGSGRIRESVEGVREAVERINNALQEQSAACRSAVEFLEEVFARTRTNEDSARRMDSATKGLKRQAEGLREDVHRFRI